MRSTSAKYVRIRAGSRVSRAKPAAAAWAPMKKSGSGTVLGPPARRYSENARATRHAALNGRFKRLTPTPPSARSSRSCVEYAAAISA